MPGKGIFAGALPLARFPLLLLLLCACPAFADEYLVLGPRFESLLAAKRAVADLRARALPAQLVTYADYAELPPGYHGVAFGAADSLEAARSLAARMKEAGAEPTVARAGTYRGVAKSGRARGVVDRHLVVAGPFDDAEEAREALAAFHGRGLFPLPFAGKSFDNLPEAAHYLAFEETASEREAHDLIREVYDEVAGLLVVRTGYLRGTGKDPLLKLPGRLEKALRFRTLFASAEEARTRGERGRALEGYRGALDLFPEHAPARRAKMKLHVELREWDEALAELAILREADRSHELDYLDCYCRLKRAPREALPAYRAFRARHPASPFLPALREAAGLADPE